MQSMCLKRTDNFESGESYACYFTQKGKQNVVENEHTDHCSCFLQAKLSFEEAAKKINLEGASTN